MNVLSFRAANKVATQATKATKGTKKVGGTERLGGAGYRKYDGDALWLPKTTRPEWLDGSLPGDRGFDPLGLSNPGTFVQIGKEEALLVLCISLSLLEYYLLSLSDPSPPFRNPSVPL